MSESKTAQKENKLVIKLVGNQSHIFEFMSELSKTKYPPESLTNSKIHKNEGDDNYHLFLTIYFNKPPPKEQTVEVKEVS